MVNQIHTKSSLWLFTFIVVLLSIDSYAQEYTIPYIIKDIALCDMDLDGHVDIATCIAPPYYIDSLFIFYNDGFGGLEQSVIASRNSIFIECADLDNDSIPDIITKDSDFLFIKNSGNRQYGPAVPFWPTNNYRYARFIADMNNDGWNDVVYSNSSMYVNWGILRNNGSLNFTDISIYDEGIGSNPLPVIGYLDQDPFLDVVVSYPASGTYAYVNQGNFSFMQFLFDSLHHSKMAIAKIDTFSHMDVMLFSYISDEIKLYENLSFRNSVFLEDGVILSDVNDYNQDGFDDYCYSKCWWTGCTDSIYISTNNQNWGILSITLVFTIKIIMNFL